MAIRNPADLVRDLAPGARLLGLDLGEKTIGLAISDPGRSVATPVETVARKRFGVDGPGLVALAQARGAGGFVLGLPVNMDGSEGPRAQSVRAFAHNLSRITDLPIVLWDERLSTVAVTRTLLDADMSRRRRAQVVDKMAAAYILQGLLDHLRHLAP